MGAMRTAMALVTSILLFTACGSGDDDDGTDSVGETGSTATDDTSETTAETGDSTDTTGEACMVDGGPAGGSGNACKDAGGVCLGDEASCAGQGGTRAAAGDADCMFDDGAGYCCVPPAPTAIDGVCAHAGGLCTPTAGCGFVDGSYGPQSECEGASAGVICCVPEWQCGPTTLVCCDMSGPTGYFPTCSCDTYDCANVPGTVLVEAAQCL